MNVYFSNFLKTTISVFGYSDPAQVLTNHSMRSIFYNVDHMVADIILSHQPKFPCLPYKNTKANYSSSTGGIIK